MAAAPPASVPTEAELPLQQERVECRVVPGVQHVLVDADGLEPKPHVEHLREGHPDAEPPRDVRAVVADAARDDLVAERLVEALHALPSLNAAPSFA